MKELLQQYASYNVWASQRLLDVARQLSDEQVRQEMVSSFSSIYKTVLHLLDAESIWWQRLKLQERISRPGDQFNGSMKELCEVLLQQNRVWKEWIAAAGEHQLQHQFKYQNSKRESFKQPVYEMLVHLFN